jgi:hypothetical protein
MFLNALIRCFSKIVQNTYYKQGYKIYKHITQKNYGFKAKYLISLNSIG